MPYNQPRKTLMHLRDKFTDLPMESIVSSVSTKGGMAGGTVYSFYGWLTSSSAAVLIGILVTVAGFVVNLIYQRKRDNREEREQLLREKREDELHQARMMQLLHDSKVRTDEQREVA